jgi:prepilin-type N-terminal cleavage/methylation domain-containing protein
VKVSGKYFYKYCVTKKGLTALELIVVVAIIAILSTVSYINFRDLDETQSLLLAAQELSVQIREAQIFGIAIKEAPNGGVYPHYGVYADTSNNPNEIIFFADIDLNGVYEEGGQDVVTSISKFKEPLSIKNLCINGTGNDNDTKCNAEEVTIVYKRPNPEPSISAIDSSDGPVSDLVYAVITLSKPDEFSRSVFVWDNGQISVREEVEEVPQQSGK